MGRFDENQQTPWLEWSEGIPSDWRFPLYAFEWYMELWASVLGNLAIVKILEHAGRFSVVVAVGLYVFNADEREKIKRFQAWQVINSARGVGGAGGVYEAMLDLNPLGDGLVGVDAPNVRLVGRKMRLWNLSRAKLSGANLSWARLNRANLSAANLSGAVLLEANLNLARLNRADLSAANLSGAHLFGADLFDANLSGANLSAAILTAANLFDTDLSGANLSGANLRAPDLWEDYYLQWERRQRMPVANPKIVTPKQVASACADPENPPMLPEGIDRPPPCPEEP